MPRPPLVSAPLPDYDRAPAQRFAMKGMVTYLPPDQLPEGKYPLLINARAYFGDAITPRMPEGNNLLSASLPSLLHSLRRMDDTTTPPTTPTSTGPNSCGTGTDVPVVSGVPWSNPGNITVQDGNYASLSITGSGTTSTPLTSPGSASGPWLNPNNVLVRDGNYATQVIPAHGTGTDIQATNFGFAIPPTAIIAAITATVVHGDIGGGGILKDHDVTLLKSGVPTGDNNASPIVWGSPPSTVTYGGDLWGTSWLPADINDPNFGIQISVRNQDIQPDTAGIDWIALQVTYTFPPISSDFLFGTNFGFAIGGGVSVSGILVEIKGYQSDISSTGNLAVTLLKSGISAGVTKAVPLPSANGFISLGNAADLWGASWLPADINAVGFGVSMQAQNSAGTSVTFNVDFVRITIFGYASGVPVNYVYISGAADKVYVNATQVASGMSGKRLAMIPFRPNTSVAPWMYIGDSAKLIKIRSDGTTYKTGIAEPTLLPTIAASGAGPISGQIYYAYKYRSSKTGAVSNPSPTAHSQFFTAASNNLSVTCTSSSDPQVDLIDIYRFGSGLLNYTYVTTILNATPQFVDNLPDTALANNPIMSLADYEPFPSIDIPKTGTLTVSPGTAAGTVNLTWASGDQFNTRWTYGTVISIAQTGSTQVTNLILFNRPGSATSMIGQIQPVGTTLPNGTYTFTITGAILAAQPLAALWGPTDNTAFMFGCQDPLRPGTLYFTTGNNPDSAAQTNSLELTSPAEPLIGGCIVGGLSLVMSAEHGWLAYPNFSQVTASIIGVVGSPFSTVMTIADRGLVTKEGICTDGGGNAFFIAKDSIRRSPGGVGSVSITDDIYNLFPHDGQPQVPYTIAGITVYPPDYSQPDGMALRFAQGYVYFDYIGTDNKRATLVYDVANAAWCVDQYLYTVTIHADNPGMFVAPGPYVPIGPLLGCSDGTIRQMTLIGAENFVNMTVLTTSFDAGEQRATKHYGDLYLETTTPPDNTGHFALTLYTDRYSTLAGLGVLSPTLIPSSPGIRVGSVVELNSGKGVYARDLSLVITLPVNAAVDSILHLWQLSTIPQPETTGERATDWYDGGSNQAKFIQGAIIEADTGGVAKNFYVESGDNGALYAFTEMLTGAVFNGRSKQAFSLSSPFVTHTMRLVPQDTVPWRLWSVEFIFQPFPEACQEWHSEFISHGLEGWQHLGEMNVAYLSDADVYLTLRPYPSLPGPPLQVVIPNSTGVQAKALVNVPAFKFKLLSYHFSSFLPFRLWKEDIEVRVGPWGRTGKYQLVRPFGGKSSEGAEV